MMLKTNKALKKERLTKYFIEQSDLCWRFVRIILEKSRWGKRWDHTGPRLNQRWEWESCRRRSCPVARLLSHLRLRRYRWPVRQPFINKNITKELNPQHNPEARWAYAALGLYSLLAGTKLFDLYFSERWWQPRSYHKYPRYRPWRLERLISWWVQVWGHPLSKYRHQP